MTEAEKAALLDKIVDAWINPGKRPLWHFNAIQDVKQRMPLLSQLIERAARETANERNRRG